MVGLLDPRQGDGTWVESRPTKWQQTWDILGPYVTGPAYAVKGLMDADLNTLLYDTGPAAQQAVKNSFNAAGTMTGFSSAVSKPKNAIGMGGLGNSRELKGHLEGVQPQELQPTVQGVLSLQMPTLSRDEMDALIGRYFPDAKVDYSQSMTDRHGPSASIYYTITTKHGPQTVRLSDHTYGNANALDLRYGQDADLAHFDLLKTFGITPDKATVEKLKPAVMKRHQENSDAHARYLEEQVNWVKSRFKKKLWPEKIAELQKRFPMPDDPFAAFGDAGQ